MTNPTYADLRRDTLQSLLSQLGRSNLSIGPGDIQVLIQERAGAIAIGLIIPVEELPFTDFLKRKGAAR